MSDRLRRAIARAMDEDSEAEHERESASHRERCEEEGAAERKRRDRELQAIERIAISFQQLAEAMSRIAVSGIQLHR
jgi:hypothetical protein